MNEFTNFDGNLHSQHTLLCALGQKYLNEKLLAPLQDLVHIPQKTLQHSPTQKLLDCLLSILCGCEAVSQVNTVLAADPALQKAWGREACADQATIQHTLSALTWDNLVEMRQALLQIFQKHSRACQHDFKTGPLILDLDMTGLPCSKKYEGATAGYFAGCKKGTAGRQLVRVSASQYDEIVYEQVFPGNTACVDLAIFQQVVQGASAVLGLSSGDKSQVLLRLDGGYGTSEIVNYLLAEGYQFIVKLHSGLRAKKLAKTVAEEAWQADSCHGRSWAELPDDHFYESGERKLDQIAVRCLNTSPKKTKKAKAKTSKAQSTAAVVENEAALPAYTYTVLIVCRQATAASKGDQLHFYDERAVIESCSFRGDKQGLKIARRRKRSLCGQEGLILLAQLAHNLLSWARVWFSSASPKLKEYGTKRMVRDVLTIPGKVKFKEGRIVKVQMSKGHRLAHRYFGAFAQLLAQSGIRLIWRET